MTTLFASVFLLQRPQQISQRGRCSRMLRGGCGRIMRVNALVLNLTREVALSQTGGSIAHQAAAAGCNNIVRATIQALSAVLRDVEPAQPTAKDEVLALPTQKSVETFCARSRSSPTKAAPPTLSTRWPAPTRRGGFSDEIEAVDEYIARSDELGGALRGGRRLRPREIQDAAYRRGARGGEGR
ncbi:MAG: hypothetical protein H6643_13030 [Caldilineaceae bacterium]|nr:hypothetical protein [Caldilineaceae bacterium]